MGQQEVLETLENLDEGEFMTTKDLSKALGQRGWLVRKHANKLVRYGFVEKKKVSGPDGYVRNLYRAKNPD